MQCNFQTAGGDYDENFDLIEMKDCGGLTRPFVGIAKCVLDMEKYVDTVVEPNISAGELHCTAASIERAILQNIVFGYVFEANGILASHSQDTVSGHFAAVISKLVHKYSKLRLWGIVEHFNQAHRDVGLRQKLVHSTTQRNF